ncbi:MAG: helix-hairpin-helix domain-containing protein [Oscillospiraceae bacterium]|nr:helix-hairpin-helix domain-containing protein [Oscillospiraceae bacterium]
MAGLGLTALVSVMTVYAAFSGEYDRVYPVVDYAEYYYGGDPAAEAGSALDPAPDNTVCINTASADELAAALPGIGPQKAKAIADYREAIGGFNSVDELMEVKGIGPATLERIRPYCVLESQPEG